MKTTQRLAAALAGALMLLAAAPAHHPAAKPPAGAPPDGVTHHSIRINGARIAYTARAGTIDLHDPTSNAVTARIFYVAYTKDGTNARKRPVTFFYNGGPGSSTIWLHMGSFGPVHLVLPNGVPSGPAPYKLVANPYSLLDKTDEVFIDAPNTGYSRVIGAGKPAQFMGVDEDGRAFTQFIERYLGKFGRWQSPKFLYGESYGTTRDAVLVNMLQQAGVTMNGVVMQSSILDFGLGAGPVAGGDWSFVLYLPTEAATAYYYHLANTHGKSFGAFMHEVETFASTTYLHDLALGANLPQAEFNADVARLHDYMGLPSAFLSESHLRVPYIRYLKELLRPENKIVGRLDARYTTASIDPMADTIDWDASDVGFSGAFSAAFNAYVRDVLHYHAGIPYRPTAYGALGARWDFKHQGNDPPANVAPDLATAMSQNPHLKVFQASGYYDFATPFFATDYTLRHLGLSPALQRNITYGYYASGHMIYINPAALPKLKADLSRWYDSAAPGSH